MYNHIQLNEPMVPRFRLIARRGKDIIQVWEFEQKQLKRCLKEARYRWPDADLSDLDIIGYIGHREGCDCCNKCKEANGIKVHFVR